MLTRKREHQTKNEVFHYLRIWSHLLKKFLMENFIFVQRYLQIWEQRATSLGEVSLPFFRNWKKCSDFGKKALFNFSIQNVIVTVSRRKNSKIFPCGAFFIVFLTKYLLKCPNSTKPPLPWKISGCAPDKVFFFPNFKNTGECRGRFGFPPSQCDHTFLIFWY